MTASLNPFKTSNSHKNIKSSNLMPDQSNKLNNLTATKKYLTNSIINKINNSKKKIMSLTVQSLTKMATIIKVTFSMDKNTELVVFSTKMELTTKATSVMTKSMEKAFYTTDKVKQLMMEPGWTQHSTVKVHYTTKLQCN